MMDRHDIRIIVGAPGSGKTYRLRSEQAAGRLDEVLEDGLEDQGSRAGAVIQVLRWQDEGRRVGICGQLGISTVNRRMICDLFDGQVHFDFMDALFSACLRNIIRDTLDDPHRRAAGWHRACRVDAIWRRGEYDMPAGVRPFPVLGSPIRNEEVEAFFGAVHRPFSEDGKGRLRYILEHC